MKELFASWWVFGFIFLCFCIFHPILKRLDVGEKTLMGSLTTLRIAKEQSQKKKEHLFFQLESQKDPQWVEMILKQELGLVSEGQTKVHFITH